MKHNIKKIIGLSMALAFVFSASVFSQTSYAHHFRSGNIRKTAMAAAKKQITRQNGTKNILIIEKDDPKSDPITYPLEIPSAEITKEADAYGCLFQTLSDTGRYDLVKNIIKVENSENYSFTGKNYEWYFSYGPKAKGEFVPEKFFAVNKNGDIFEYNFDKAAWFMLALTYRN